MAEWLPVLLPTYVKSDGTVAQGYYVKFFEPDGAYTTLKTAYKDAGKTQSHTNPAVIDASGFPTTVDFYGDGLYDVKIYDGDPDTTGNLVRSIRNIGSGFTSTLTDGLGGAGGNLIFNWSFELDEDSDAVPDQWTLAAASGATLARDTTDSNHGVASLKMVSAGAAGTGTGTSAFFECSPSTNYILAFDLKASVANVNPKVQISWYDRSQVLLSTSTLYNVSTGVPTSYTRYSGMVVTSPASAVYGKCVLTGSANATAGTIRFDNIAFTQENTTVSPWGRRGLYVTNGTDTDHDIDIAVGEVRDSTNTYNLIVTSALTKRIDAAWAVGTGNGGIDTGSIGADTLYAVYLIGNPTTGVVDAVASTSFTSPSLPSGYTKYRRIWAFLTDSSNNIRNWIDPISNYHRLLDPFNDVNDSSITDDTFETVTASCPPNSLWHIYGRTYNATNESRGISIRTYGTQDIAPGAGAQESFIFCRNGATTDTGITASGFVLVDADRKAEYAVEENGGTNVASIVTFGWMDLGIG